MKTCSLIYSAPTAIPATPVQNVSVTTDIRNLTFRRLDNFFIGISPVIFKLTILNTIANRSKSIATGIDGTAVTPVSAQYTNFISLLIISKIFRKVNGDKTI
ncbi:hypothetical protein EMIT0180MI3_110022 [Priestia megaterium]